jgi:hypothetical protein
MKTTIKILPLLMLFIAGSCTSVRVTSDYDKKADFSTYKTFAFYKNGIDKVQISDLDKKRILRSVEEVMTTKGFSKSDTPDLLVNIFTKSTDNVYVDSYWGYGWGYGPYWGYSPYWGGYPYAYTDTEGTLFVDLIDAKTKQLVWQGEGSGDLTNNSDKKDERVREFVTEILGQYPPGKK